MVKIVSLAILFAFIILYLKSIDSQLTLPTTVVASIILLSFAFEALAEAFSFINSLIELTGLNKDLYSILFKITAIGYIVEFGADIVADFGLKSLSDKLIFVGKIVIFSISLPIIYAVFNLFTGLLQ